MSQVDPNRPTPHIGPRLRRDLRQIRLRELGYRNYPHYLRSAHWADVRREYQSSGLPQDCFCGETEGIQLHHMTYERVGREELADLTPVCPTCHAMIHALEARGEIGLDFTGFVNEQRGAKRRAEVEAFKYERLMSFLEDAAFIEDLRREMQRITKEAKRLKMREAHWLHRVVANFKRIETRFENLQSQHT